MPDAVAACARQTGLEQRARLLTAVWRDLQHERRAVSAGALPDRLPVPIAPGRAAVERYAADLVWCPDRVWRVARDYVAPHPGAGLLEAPVLAAFLPCLCRLFLGESLALPSMPVLWLGDARTWPALAATSHRFRIRDGFDPDSEPVALAGLSACERRSLQAMVDADPRRYVAELLCGDTRPVRHALPH